jgi:menaquinone-9 beta-reductase
MADYPRSDITIIGTGPAGITAALALAKRGIPCLLIDKDHFPREKICGDGIGGKVVSTLNKLNPEYSRELELKEFTTGSHAVRFFSPSIDMMELSFDPENTNQLTGFTCRRRDFDNFLAEKAFADPNIDFREGIHVTKLFHEKGRIVLQDPSGKTIADTKLLMVAAGMDKMLLKQLPETESYPAREGIGVRGYFENVSGSDHNHAIEIHFLRELLPWYLWIFPFSDGSANVGLALPEATARKSSLSLKELLFELIGRYPHLKSRFAHASLQGKIEAKRLPYYNGPCRISGNNYMLLGDAARLIDPFTGEGIGNAMLSGYIAGNAAADCVEHGHFNEHFTIKYQQQLYQKLQPELSLSLKLQMLARNRRLLNLVIGRASRDEKLRQSISEMLYSDKAKSKLRNPLFYLKILLGI